MDMKNLKTLLAHQSQSVRCSMAALFAGLMLAAVPASAQKAYDSAEAAAEAFKTAVASGDSAAMRTVLGKDWKSFIPTQDIEKSDIDTFLAGWGKAHSIRSQTPDKALLEVGDQGWTLPIPIVKQNRGGSLIRWQALMKCVRAASVETNSQP
jgi:hypothetical protein